MDAILNKEKVQLKKAKRKNRVWIDIKKDWDLYLLLIPGILTLFLFKYTPFYGLLIAFQDFNIFSGIAGSEWVGLDNFRRLFSSREFSLIFQNTLVISITKIIFLFPLPIFIAVMLNEIINTKFKKAVQTVIYLPHFISWVIVSGLFINLLSINGGIINRVIESLGGQPVGFFMDKEWFRLLLVFTDGWKEVGWGTIVYLAAIVGIEQEQFEAAKIDGANKFQQILNITIPNIAPTIILMFILRLGNILEAGTEQILVMYNPIVYEVADVIGTYVFRVGLGTSDYSFSTAVGLFNSVISFVLIVSGNKLTKKYFGKSIW